MTPHSRKVIARALKGYDQLNAEEREAIILGILDLIPAERKDADAVNMRDTLAAMLAAIRTEREMQTDFIDILLRR